LGKPEKKSALKLWGADGEYHQDYIYKSKGIEIDFIGKKESSKSINMITISKPCALATSNNIRIGSMKEDVERAYDGLINPEFSNSETIVVGSIFGGLVFILKNNKVESIFIGASAE
jgi:hypothetical protein